MDLFLYASAELFPLEESVKDPMLEGAEKKGGHFSLVPGSFFFVFCFLAMLVECGNSWARD